MIYMLTGAALFVLGIVGIILQKSLIQKVISFNLFTSGIFLIFITTSYEKSADSTATALVLTGLVVALAATALALVLIRSLYGASDDA